MKHTKTSIGLAQHQTEQIPKTMAENRTARSLSSLARGIFFSALLVVGSFAYATISKADDAQIMANETSAANSESFDVEPNLLVLTKVDRAAIQFVVKMHIASLNQQRADLFHKTFTQKTQSAFNSPDEMLVFFTLRYLPIVFAEDFRFASINLEGKVPVQHGYLTDKRGKRWRVSYGLQHLGDGDWRIISSALVLAPGYPA